MKCVVDWLSSVSVTGSGPRMQPVMMAFGDAESWTLVDRDAAVVEPAEGFLSHLHAVERSPNTVKAYAHDLRDWFEFLDQHGLDWSRVRLEDVGRSWPGCGCRRARGRATWRHWPPSRPCARRRRPTGNCRRSRRSTNSTTGTAWTLGSARDVAAPHDSWWIVAAVTGALGISTERSTRIRLRAQRRIPDTLDGEQIAAIVAACDRLRDRFLFTLLGASGLRIGEALGLRHSDIDAAARLVAVVPRVNANRARAKGVGGRRVPVPARVIRLYADYLHGEYGDLDSDYVFVSLWSGRIECPLTYASVYDLVCHLRKRTGIMFGPHTFRHSYATGLLRRGVAVEVVQHLLGHASIATTGDAYAHLKVEDARRALVAAGWLTDQDGPS